MIIFNSCSCSHLCSLNEADRSHTESAMSKSIVSIALANIELEPGSIPQEWVLSGNPETRSKVLVRSHDWIANLVVWECGAVSYKWHYNQDEEIGRASCRERTAVERGGSEEKRSMRE